MTGSKKIRSSIFLTIAGLLVFGVFSVNAQIPQNPPVQRDRTAPAPTPTQTPVPKKTEDIIEDDDVVKIDTELVNVLFTAQDKDRRLLTELKKEDIRIFEDGQQQEIFTFMRQTDLPLSIAILIDTSQSQERTLPEEKDAAKAFIESVVRPNKDEVSVLSFTGETTLEQDLTGNVNRLRRAVDRVQFVPASGTAGGGVVVGTPPISGGNQQVAGSTAIWDAVWVTSNEILGKAPDRTRRAIVLLTDGVNTFGNKKLDDAVSEAIRNDVIIYTIGVGDDFYSGVDKSAIRKISERTGGRAYFPMSEGELRQAFNQIQIEMRSQYLLAYAPGNPKKDGTFRKIEIQVANPAISNQKVKLTHRQGYFAKTESNKK